MGCKYDHDFLISFLLFHVNIVHFTYLCKDLEVYAQRDVKIYSSLVQGLAPKAGTFLAFGGGSRRCPGNDLAKLEMSVFLHYFLLDYQWVVLTILNFCSWYICDILLSVNNFLKFVFCLRFIINSNFQCLGVLAWSTKSQFIHCRLVRLNPQCPLRYLPHPRPIDNCMAKIIKVSETSM